MLIYKIYHIDLNPISLGQQYLFKIYLFKIYSKSAIVCLSASKQISLLKPRYCKNRSCLALSFGVSGSLSPYFLVRAVTASLSQLMWLSPSNAVPSSNVVLGVVVLGVAAIGAVSFELVAINASISSILTCA